MSQVIPHKTCPSCRQTFPATTSFFGRNGSKKDGLQTYCKKCHNKNTKKYKEVNKVVNTYTPHPPESKRCAMCGEIKPASDFHVHVRNKDGLESYCKECTKFKVKFSLYGLTKKEFYAMLEVQDNKCFICGMEFNSRSKAKEPHVHHDHTTGKVKAILCPKCNMALGVFKDDAELLKKALKLVEGETT